ncbi:MAG: methyltransferase domain-containing protein [Acidimicrobiales bacterium]|jgi:TDG/mug DNA glycosylase family protein
MVSAVDRATVDVYDQRGGQWAARRRPVRRADARRFGGTLGKGARCVDLGCGAGRYTADLGASVIGLDASRGMLELCRQAAPGIPLVQADLESLPFGRCTVHGAWANMSYLHVPSVRLPAALADLHGVLATGAALDIQVLAGDYEGHALPDDDVGGRFFAAWGPEALRDVLVGAGFVVEHSTVDGDALRARCIRARTLPDTVGPRMRLLVVGLNPSLYAADAGVGFARPGNRFWPAAIATGLVTRDRDPVHALHAHGMGMTDLVKRATTGAGELAATEYRTGMQRVERSVAWLRPAAVCFVGLAGWRAAVDRHAVAGQQECELGGRPVYVMPSTSGANAGSSLQTLATHLAAAITLADQSATVREVHKGVR